MKGKKARYPLLDVLRGFALVNMILYHALWDVVNLFGVSIPWYNGNLADIWQIFICVTFIVLSGFCTRFNDKNKMRRGVTVLMSGMIVSAVTIIIMPASDSIYFGVLTLIGSCMLITAFSEKWLLKVNHGLGFFICLFLFFLTEKVSGGIVSLFGIKIAELPEWLYKNLFTAYFGFPHKSFASSDYFPLLPWVFAYMTGFFLFGIIHEKGLAKYLSAVENKPLQWLGRHSLLIYLLHQPVLYGVMYIFL